MDISLWWIVAGGALLYILMDGWGGILKNLGNFILIPIILGVYGLMTFGPYWLLNHFVALDALPTWAGAILFSKAVHMAYMAALCGLGYGMWYLLQRGWRAWRCADE